MTASSNGNRELQQVAETGGGDEPETEESPLDADTYGAAMFSIIEDLRELFGGADTDGRPYSLNVVRLCFCVSVLLANYGLQFGMLYFVDRFIVIDAQADMIEAPPEDALVIRHSLFVGTILVLWTISILIETRKVERFARTFNALPICTTLKDMVDNGADEEGNEKFSIKALTRPIWWTLAMFIVLPKFLITLALLVFGFQWLMCTPGEADLILNALALEFVINVDEQLYDGLLPKCIKEKMEHVFLVKEKKTFKDNKAKHDASITNEKAAWNRSIVFYILPIVVSTGYCMYTQNYLHAEELAETITTTLAATAKHIAHGHGTQGHHEGHHSAGRR